MKLMIRLKNKIKAKSLNVRGWGGLGIISNWYLYEVVYDGKDVVGFLKSEVMSWVVELSKQGCLIAVKKISHQLNKD